MHQISRVNRVLNCLSKMVGYEGLLYSCWNQHYSRLTHPTLMLL